MRRREFIASAAAVFAMSVLASPISGQEAKSRPRVAILMGSTDNPESRRRVAALLEELKRLGWNDGSNVSIDLRWGGLNPSDEARKLVSSKPDLLVAGPTNAYLPVQKHTRTIPIVFVSVSDPLGQGFIKSIAKPGGNATGFSNLEFSLLGKWIQLLKESAPGLKRVGLLISTSNASSPLWYQTFNEVAPTFQIDPLPLPLHGPELLRDIIGTLAAVPHSSLIVPGDSVVEAPSNRREIIALTALHHLPALYGVTSFASEGGFMTYGIDAVDPYRRAASYVDRILRGEKPGSLPVQAPNKFSFTVNLKAAKELGLNLSPTFVGTADEVIE